MGSAFVGATKADKAAAMFLIERKLTGQQKFDACAFVKHRARRPDIERLTQRLQDLPDVEGDT